MGRWNRKAWIDNGRAVLCVDRIGQWGGTDLKDGSREEGLNFVMCEVAVHHGHHLVTWGQCWIVVCRLSLSGRNIASMQISLGPIAATTES